MKWIENRKFADKFTKHPQNDWHTNSSKDRMRAQNTWKITKIHSTMTRNHGVSEIINEKKGLVN